MLKATGFAIVALSSLTGCMSSVEVAAGSAPWVVNHTINITMPSKLAGQCLDAPLVGDSQGNLACVVIEASHDPSGQASCDGPGWAPVPASDRAAIDAAKTDQQRSIQRRGTTSVKPSSCRAHRAIRRARSTFARTSPINFYRLGWLAGATSIPLRIPRSATLPLLSIARRLHSASSGSSVCRIRSRERPR